MKRFGRPFPPYAFVPGLFPHPRSGPDGHSYGQPEPPAQALDPIRWAACETYLWGIDLFHAGYYWEAHEAWEVLWHQADPAGPIKLLLKGLIRLAAAGVKVRQGNLASVVSHAAAARDLFHRAAEIWRQPSLCGLDLSRLDAFAGRVGENPARWRGDARLPVQIVFDRRLM